MQNMPSTSDDSMKTLLLDTLEMRQFLLGSIRDLVNKQITPSDARARSWLARSVLDTMRIEMIAAREGLKVYKPISFGPPTIDEKPIK